LANSEPSVTNRPSPSISDVLIDALGDKVKKIDDNKDMKKKLKNFGKILFGE